MRLRAGRRRVRTGRLGRARRAGLLLLSLLEVQALLLGAVQVRSFSSSSVVFIILSE
jgi:hypothetical protein